MSCLDKFHILEIENLSVVFHQYAKRTKKQELPVISNLNVSVHEGEIVAVVGVKRLRKKSVSPRYLRIASIKCRSKRKI